MPHMQILYTAGLDEPGSSLNMQALCSDLAQLLVTARDAQGRAIFPTGGVRVLAYPTQYAAIADQGQAGRAASGNGNYEFIYLNLRIGRGRNVDDVRAVGRTLEACLRQHVQTLLTTRYVGVTLQIDEGQEIFDAKISSLHPLFTA